MSAIVATIGVALALGLTVVTAAVARMATDEARSRVEALPMLLVRLAVWLAPASQRADRRVELEGELHVACHQTDGLPITRLCKGMTFATGQIVAAMTDHKLRGALIGVVANTFGLLPGLTVLYGTAPLHVCLVTTASAGLIGLAALRIGRGSRPANANVALRLSRIETGIAGAGTAIMTMMVWLLQFPIVVALPISILLISMYGSVTVYQRSIRMRHFE